jgi:parvulin-like peptidyl-prolyl isomerase
MRIGLVLGFLAMIAASVAIRCYWGTELAGAESPARPAIRSSAAAQAPQQAAIRPAATQAAAAIQPATPPMRIMAAVNGEEITRDELARECLKHYGGQVLEHMVNKYLIKQECERLGVTVTQAEVNAEVERMATRFGLAVDQWLKLLQDERGINPRQYANDVIWPTLALRKLAGDRFEVTEQELTGRYEAQYGPAVQARLIVVNERQKADQVRAAAAADPESFARLAKESSVDPSSASMGGVIQPIRKYAGQKEIENVAFGMQEGQISPVIPVGDQFVILKCEGILPARKVPLEQVKPGLIETLRQDKLRVVSDEIFGQLQEKAQVQNVLNDPVLSQQMPGVAALINGQRVNDRELAELCIDRHGEEVLEGTINLRLLEQACRRQNVEVSDADVDAEIREAAAIYLRPKQDGSPDVEGWLEMVTREQDITVEAYRDTAVWPTVALKKLVGDSVEISEEDLKRGYEANFGQRVKCLAIVLNNLRQAQQVWSKAQQNPTPEFFGDLAEQYSVEPTSRALRGEVPPLERYGGQKKLEDAAFSLAPGELSSIVQTGPELYVILLSLGMTDAVQVEFAEVRDEIYKDVYEKKQRLAMAEYFQSLQESATIDNFLAGTSRSPQKVRQAGLTTPVK